MLTDMCLSLDLSEFCEYIVADMFCMASPLSESPPRSPGSSPGSKKNPPRLAEFIVRLHISHVPLVQ